MVSHGKTLTLQEMFRDDSVDVGMKYLDKYDMRCCLELVRVSELSGIHPLASQIE